MRNLTGTNRAAATFPGKTGLETGTGVAALLAAWPVLAQSTYTVRFGAASHTAREGGATAAAGYRPWHFLRPDMFQGFP